MTTDKQQVIKDIQRLHSEGEDIDAISREIKSIKDRDKERIVSGLKAVADLEQLKKQSSMRRFVLVYWYGNEAKVVHGVEFGYGTTFSKDEEGRKMRVFLLSGDYGMISYEFVSMSRLRETLDSLATPYHIAYLND